MRMDLIILQYCDHDQSVLRLYLCSNTIMILININHKKKLSVLKTSIVHKVSSTQQYYSYFEQ